MQQSLHEWFQLSASTRQIDRETQGSVGGYVPQSAENADRLARLDAIHAALTAGPRAQPQAYWLATLRVNAEECSEDAVMLLDPATNAMWIIHRFPRC